MLNMERFLWVFMCFYALNTEIHLVKCAMPHPQETINNIEGQYKMDPRIVGGHKAHLGDVPGIVSIQTWKGEHMCGGTWIRIENQSQILTAAHCVMNSKNELHPRLLLRVVGDDLSISRLAPGTNRQIRKIRKVVVHPNYSATDLKHDIAMIFLASPFQATNTFTPVPIANKSVVSYQPCTIAGWGALEERGPHSTELMLGNVSVVPRIICNSKDSYKGMVSPKAFCAGTMDGGTDSCQGDSGGGLMSKNRLVGIVSFGTGCGRPNYPGVYTDVYSYSNWIKETINSAPSMSQSNAIILAAIAAIHITRSIFV